MLDEQEVIVLRILAYNDRDWLTGLAIARIAEWRVEWNVYTILTKFETQGWIVSRERGGYCYHRITRLGRDVFSIETGEQCGSRGPLPSHG